jgi:hypothetical protein
MDIVMVGSAYMGFWLTAVRTVGLVFCMDGYALHCMAGCNRYTLGLVQLV